VLDFRIRVFALNSNNVELTSNKEEWIHMEEFALGQLGGDASEKTTLSIPCAQFDIIYEKFCFELISTERRTRHFELWDRKCVRTEGSLILDFNGK
jgi:hypothetical protein